MNTKDLLHKYQGKSVREINNALNLSLGSISKHSKNQKPAFKVDNAIIYAAGKGSRLMPLTAHKPKPLVEINGLPIIETTIQNLLSNNITNITIVAGYHKEAFENLLKKYAQVKLIINDEFDSHNNIVSLKCVKDILKNTLLIEGDIFWKEDMFSDSYSGPSMYAYELDKPTEEWVFIKKGKYVTDLKKGSNVGGLCWAGTYFISEEQSSQIRKFFNEKYSVFEHSHLYAEQLLWMLKMQFNVIVIKKSTFEEIDTIEDYLKSNKVDHANIDDPTQAAAFYMGTTEDNIYKLTPIKGGLTNNTFSFIYKNEEYVLRLPKEETNKNINRFVEYDILEGIKKTHFAPTKIVFNQNTGVAIFKFINFESYLDIENEIHLKFIANALKELHQIELPGIPNFKVIDIINNFKNLKMDFNHPDDPLLKKLESRVNSIIRKYYHDTKHFVLCHNDLLNSNLLMLNDKAIIIDWELGANNDAYWDLASLFSENEFSKEQIETFEKSYGPIDRSKLAEFQLLMNYCWAHWTYQHSKWTQEYKHYFTQKIKVLERILKDE